MDVTTTTLYQRLHLKKILEGEGLYGDLVGLWHFFCDILRYCCDLESDNDIKKNGYYVAYMTRRCHVLVQIFRDAVFEFDGTPDEERPGCLKGQNLNKWKDIFSEHFITDTTLIAMSTDFVRHCIASGEYCFPRLIIVDELMVHGRSLNNLLHKMERYLLRVCDQEGLPQDKKQEMLDSFLRALELRIYMKNSRSNLLLKRYAQRQHGEAVTCIPSVWRKFSILCTRFISHYPVNNVSSSWDFFSSGMEEALSLAENPSSDFRMIPIEWNNVSEQNYIWLYPNAAAPKAICAVRTKLCIDEKGSRPPYRLTFPFIIHRHLSFDTLWQLHGKILKDLTADMGSDDKFQSVLALFSHYDKQIENDLDFGKEVAYRWISETNDLVLNALLMKKFHRDFPSAERDIPRYDQLARNFIYFSPKKDSKVSKSVENALRAIWEWIPDDPEGLLRRYLDQLLAQVVPLESEVVFGTSGGTPVNWSKEKEREYVIYGVEDAISEIAYAAERNAYERYSNSFDYSDQELTRWGSQYDLSALLPKCQRYLAEYLEEKRLCADLYQVMAVVVYAMDYGLMGMHTTRTRPPKEDNVIFVSAKVQKPIEYYTVQHAGEVASFILPHRYRVFLPVLADIQSWRGNDTANARLEIARFLQRLRLVNSPKDNALLEKDFPLLEEKLSWLFYLMSWTGQQYRDWNFLFDDDPEAPERINLAKRYLNIYRG